MRKPPECGKCSSRSYSRRKAECLECGRKLMLCSTCWQFFSGCGEIGRDCREKHKLALAKLWT